ncbi:hypothetical protein MOQ72_18400 [Saccharopolyspora sp. K220]|uniref:hypothetical protein n=1 Tax=Saccharopolyspora soli TaxID=2926618 RepID=UPI001F572996|nr:hypothetical protein [Saccharopolyspora soli]MCI2419416.1 hypothetical protein [Saccharopolyspora soli]
MEHPSTSRRRDRSASDTVTVAELIKRQPMSPEHEQLADQLLRTAEPTDSTPPLGTRIALCTLGVLLLLGATAASGMIIAEPVGTPRQASSATPIKGALALRPDLVRDARWPFTANGGFAAAADSGPTDAAPEAAERSAANPAAGSDESAINVVTEFYRDLEQDPTTAASLVAPELLAGQQAQLAEAWDAVQTVQPSVRAVSAGEVLAEVEAGYPDGHRVVLRQLLTVESGTNPQIVGAELLSARHVPPQ